MKFKNILDKLTRVNQFTTGIGNTDLQLMALKMISDTVVITDIKGKILWVNDSFQKLTAYSPDEAVGSKIGVLLKSGKHKDQFYQDLWDTALSGRIWKGVITNKRKNGSLYFEAQTITPIAGRNGRIVNFIIFKKDITEKLTAKETLMDSELRWQFALEGAGDGLWDWDLKTGKVFFSKQWKDMFGYSDDEVDDTLDSWRKKIHPEDLERCYGDLKKHFDGETEVYQNEHRILCKDDTYKWILDRGNVVSWSNDGRPLRVIGTHTDISDRKNAEEALRQKSEEMERFFTVALDLLCIADIDGNIIRVNRAWERTLGYSMDELEGQNLLNFVHPDDLHSTKLSLAALADQLPIMNHTNRYRTSEGDYRCIEWRSYPSGEYIYAAARDITDRINYEYELNKLAERLTLATESAKIGIWDWYLTTGELIWDKQMYELYGLNEEITEDLSGAWNNTIHPEDREYIKNIFIDGVKNLSVFQANFRIFRPDGTLHYLEGHALVIREENNRAVRITGVNRDVTERKIMEEKLVTLSTTDPLTMAYNRRYLLHVLESEISRAVRYSAVFSLIMFDIDHFKNVNDTYGHDAGDEILKGIVEMMQKRIRKNDVLARWGGEEFMIFLSGTGFDNARGFADKLIVELREMQFALSGRITASFGVTEYKPGDTNDSVLKRVDELVYLAKNEGRNCVRSG